MSYEDVKSWRLPEPEHFEILGGLLRGALMDFAKYVADNEPEVSEAEVLKYLDEWGQRRKLPINKGDTRFWDDVLNAPREYPPFTHRSDEIPGPGQASEDADTSRVRNVGPQRNRPKRRT